MKVATKSSQRTIRIEQGFNRAEVRADTLDQAARTVEVMWSSGIAVKRYSWDEGFYMEELSMQPKHLRLDRFETGMSLLDAHESWSMKSRLGTVVPGSVRIAGGKGYATIKFSKNEMGETIFRDLLDGHPVQISVGYKIHSFERIEGKGKELPTFRAIDWEPTELSVVPVPAEPGAGSRAENGRNEGYDVPVLGPEVESQPAAAAETKEPPMDKITAARSLKGKELDTLALGAGLGRKDNESDEALSARLVAHFEAQERAEKEAKERAEAEAKAKADAEAAAAATAPGRADPAATTPPAQTAPLSQADIDAAVTRALEADSGRRNAIIELARKANISETDAVVVNAVNSRGVTLDQFRSQLIDHMVANESRAQTFPVSSMRGMTDEREKMRRIAVNGLMHRHGLTDKLEEGANMYRNMSTLDLARDLLIASGGYQRGDSSIDVVRKALNGSNDGSRALHTTSDFPIILGEITRQVLMGAYSQYQQTFSLIANRNTVTDLREVKVLEMGEGPQLEKLTEKGEYKRGTFKESEEGFTIAHYGKIVGLTEAMLINDQLGAFAKLIAGWGRVVARLEGDIVWDIVVSNAKLKSDGKALFHADHGNLGAAAALSKDNLIAARKMFRKQKDIDGNLIDIAPKYLFVGSDNEVTAQTITQATTNPATPDQVVPEAIRSLVPVYEPRIDKISDKAWLLFMQTADTMGRGLQYSYLSGYESPRTMERWGFDYDGVEYRLDHYFGAGLTDYRFAYKNPGA
jgi:hypothetical protein